MIYLTDVDAGGRTIFPQLGLSASPVEGDALFWFNLVRKTRTFLQKILQFLFSPGFLLPLRHSQLPHGLPGAPRQQVDRKQVDQDPRADVEVPVSNRQGAIQALRQSVFAATVNCFRSYCQQLMIFRLSPDQSTSC